MIADLFFALQSMGEDFHYQTENSLVVRYQQQILVQLVLSYVKQFSSCVGMSVYIKIMVTDDIYDAT